MSFAMSELLQIHVQYPMKKENDIEGIFYSPIWKDDFYKSNALIFKK